jgi:hypothetical protein
LISTNNVAWYPFISLLLASCQEPGEGDCSISPKQVSRKNPRVLIVINRRCELRSPILLAVPTACDRGDVSLSRPEFGSATVGATTLSSYALLGAFRSSPSMDHPPRARPQEPLVFCILKVVHQVYSLRLRSLRATEDDVGAWCPTRAIKPLRV